MSIYVQCGIIGIATTIVLSVLIVWAGFLFESGRMAARRNGRKYLRRRIQRAGMAAMHRDIEEFLRNSAARMD